MWPPACEPARHSVTAHRTAAIDAERARVAVRKAITAALDWLAVHDSAFAQHLRIHIRTGIFCRYEPDPTNLIRWDVAG